MLDKKTQKSREATFGAILSAVEMDSGWDYIKGMLTMATCAGYITELENMFLIDFCRDEARDAFVDLISTEVPRDVLEALGFADPELEEKE